MIEQGIRAKILQIPAVAALVGTRMSPVLLIQGGLFPAIRYGKVDGAADKTLKGPSSLKNGRWQFDCCSAVSVAEAKTLAKALNDGFNGFKGSVTGGKVRRATALDDGTEIDLQELGLFGVQLDYSIWYTEA